MKRILAIFSLMLCLVFSAQATQAANSFLPALSLESNLKIWGGSYIESIWPPSIGYNYEKLDSVIPASGYYDVTLAYIGSSNALVSNGLALAGTGAIDYVENLLPSWIQGNSLFNSLRDIAAAIPSALSPDAGKLYTAESVFLSSFLLDLVASALDYIPDFTFDLAGFGEIGIQFDITSYLYTGDEKAYEWNGVSMLLPTDTVFVGINIFALDLFGVTIEQNMDIVLALTKSSAVPIPGAVLLLGTGLGGIAMLRRKIAA